MKMQKGENGREPLSELTSEPVVSFIALCISGRAIWPKPKIAVRVFCRRGSLKAARVGGPFRLFRQTSLEVCKRFGESP